MSEPEQIVNAIARQIRALMTNHWQEIAEFRDGEEKIKVGFSHQITLGQERIVETKISFAKRVTDSVSESIETAQTPLKFTAPTMPIGPATIQFVKPGKRGRGRPRKLTTEP